MISLSKMEGAFSLVKVTTKGSLFAKTNSAIADLSNLPSAEIRNRVYKLCNSKYHIRVIIPHTKTIKKLTKIA